MLLLRSNNYAPHRFDTILHKLDNLACDFRTIRVSRMMQLVVPHVTSFGQR